MLFSGAVSCCATCYVVMLSVPNFTQCIVVRFEVSTAVMLKIKVFWDVNNVLADKWLLMLQRITMPSFVGSGSPR
jgi:hypothetical protein